MHKEVTINFQTKLYPAVSSICQINFFIKKQKVKSAIELTFVFISTMCGAKEDRTPDSWLPVKWIVKKDWIAKDIYFKVITLNNKNIANVTDIPYF